MPKINLDTSKCVAYSSKHSNCDLCQNICPTNAIDITENRVSFIYNSCVECGGCVGICPTQSLTLESFNTTKFFIEFLKDEENLISCKKNIPCLSILSIEHLIALKIQRDFDLDIGHCKECYIKESLLNKIENNIKEANYVLNALGVDKTIEAKEIKYNKIEEIKEEEKSENNKDNRRNFLKRFSLKGAVETKVKFDDEVINITETKTLIEINSNKSSKKREKFVPDKRKILYTSIKSLQKPQNYSYLNSEDVSFTSNKLINSSCNNCSICYRICPSGALNSDKKNSTIYFDSLLCLKCNLCHDVCELNSVEFIPIYSKEFFEPKNRVLAEFKIKRCNECNNLFTYIGGEQICKRCRIEEEEAIHLWRLN